MRLNMLMLFCIAVLFMTLQTVLTETVQSSVITADCLSNGDLYQMYVDTAQVSFSLERNGSPVGAFLNAFALFAVNADCYECLPQIVLPANATTINKCAQMWSPFNWTFTVRNTVTHEEFPNLNLTTVFGERGSYTLTAFLTSDTTPVFVGLNVATVAQPENSLTALWIWLFAIFLPIIILNFTGAPIAVWLRQQWCRCCEYFQRYISCFHSKASESATSNGCDPAEYRLLEDGNADITTPLTAKALDGRLKEQPSAAEQASSPYPINTPAKANYTPSQAAGSFWEAFMSPAAGDNIWADKPSFDGRATTMQVPLVSPAPTPVALDDAHSGANSRAVTLDVGATTNTVLTRRTPAEERGPINASANPTAALTPYTKTEKPAAAASSGSRLDCLDTFRGMCLTFMIFVNYGGGGYWFFDHASWNGLTFADLLFPWFMWVMGVSMALSLKRLHSDEYRGTILDPFCKYPAGLNSAHKHYTVHVLEAGSSKGWSQIESAPSTPHRSSHASSNNSSEQHAASLEQAATVANTTANTAALMAPPALTPMPTPSRPQPTTGQAAAKVTIPQPSWPLWRRVLRRACILYALGCFLNNGYNVAVTGHFRVLGVLQYFGISTLVVGATILGLRQRTAALLAAFERQQIQLNEKLGPATGRAPPAVVQAGAEFLDTFGVAALPPTEPFSYKNVYHWLRLLDIRQSVMWCYKWEYLVMTLIFSFYLIICLGVAAPGCPVGYNGPGGRASGGEYAQCTGGIHRYIDMSIVGWNHFYHKPTCIDLYDCEAYDPEGLLGSLTACTLTYLGIVTGRILMHYPTHAARLSRWWVLGGALCLLAALLCGFSQNDGAIPVNKNLWSASFGLLMGGGGMIALSGVYFLVDQRGWWTGAPFRYLGLNSILLYVGHELLQGYFPFEWAQEFPTHMSLITMNIIGVTLWALIARYCYAIKFFVKI